LNYPQQQNIDNEHISLKTLKPKMQRKKFPNLETKKWTMLKVKKDILISDEKLSQLVSSKIRPPIITILWDHLGV
jgi:hypothetical protein